MPGRGAIPLQRATALVPASGMTTWTPGLVLNPATATAPATLGPQAPRSGLLAAGYDADVITVDADPLADISVLAKPAHVTAVWTAGRQVKGAAPE